MTSARPRISAYKLVMVWALLALAIPGLRVVKWAASPAQVAASQGSNLADLEPLFGDAPRYYAYAQAMLGRPYDSYYIRSAEGWRQDTGPPHRLVTPERPLVPWRDFLIEYPPGALLAMMPPAWLSGGLVSYCVLFSLEMSLCFTLALALGVGAAERLRAGAGSSVLQGGVVYLLLTTMLVSWHYDALVALALAGFAYGVVAGRPMLAALALAGAVLVKGAPALLIPIVLTHFLLTSPWRRVAGAGAAAGLLIAGVAAAYLAVAGPHALDMFAYHAQRPVQVESPYGALALVVQMLGGPQVRTPEGFGSVNIEVGYEPAMRAFAGPLTGLAVAAVIGWRLWRLGRDDDATTRARRTLGASAAALIAFMAFGKVLSPQYVVWLFPLALLPAVTGAPAAAVTLIAAVLLTQIEFPFLYGYSVRLLGFVVLARDALLMATAWLLTVGASYAAKPSLSREALATAAASN